MQIQSNQYNIRINQGRMDKILSDECSQSEVLFVTDEAGLLVKTVKTVWAPSPPVYFNILFGGVEENMHTKNTSRKHHFTKIGRELGWTNLELI